MCIFSVVCGWKGFCVCFLLFQVFFFFYIYKASVCGWKVFWVCVFPSSSSFFFWHPQSVSLLNWLTKLFKCWSHRSCLWFHQHTRDCFIIFSFNRSFFPSNLVQHLMPVWWWNLQHRWSIHQKFIKEMEDIYNLFLFDMHTNSLQAKPAVTEASCRYFCWSGQVSATSSTWSFSQE